MMEVDELVEKIQAEIDRMKKEEPYATVSIQEHETALRVIMEHEE